MGSRAFKNAQNIDVGFVELPDSSTEQEWAMALASARVNFIIKSYQEKASDLIRNLYVTNTLAGITTQQSDQMFTDMDDVLVRLKEGAWPTALYRLNQKQPSGFVTQELIDSWKIIIQGAM